MLERLDVLLMTGRFEPVLKHLLLEDIKQPWRICKCETRCENFLKVEGFGIMCEEKAVEFAIRLINLARGMNISQGNYAGRGWTTQQEHFLKEWVEKKGVKYGDYRLISEILGKKRENVKNKVQHMEREGKIVRRS